jgi:Flp pilus assembly protein TadD
VGGPVDQLSPDDRQPSERAAQEHVNVQHFNADRPEARVTLGTFFARRRNGAEAEAEYRAAMRLWLRSIQAYVNLADLYRSLNRDADGEAILREALAIAPDDAAAQHALGLTLVRKQRLSEAMPLLAVAVPNWRPASDYLCLRS